MIRPATFGIATVLAVLAAAAMAWSAVRPGSALEANIGITVETAITEFAGWFGRGPGAADGPEASRSVWKADAERGASLILRNGCGACHTIPGITGARGSVGPGLAGFADRAYIAGILPNEPGELVRWLIDPPASAPETAMPALGITEGEARDMAAYLYTLRGA